MIETFQTLIQVLKICLVVAAFHIFCANLLDANIFTILSSIFTFISIKMFTNVYFNKICQ